MFLGRIRGHVIATQKDPSLRGQRLVVVEPLKVDYADAGEAAGPGEGGGGRFEVTGRAIVALDKLGAGEGQLVLIAQGSSARMAEGCNKVPVDAVVVGIVDGAQLMGRKMT
jgi:ethanolamine utilization protein EutN